MKKLLLFPELRERGVLLSRRQVDRQEAEGKFPKRVPMCDRRVGWVTDEIDAYVDRAIASRSMQIGTLGSFDVRRRAQDNNVAPETIAPRPRPRRLLDPTDA